MQDDELLDTTTFEDQATYPCPHCGEPNPIDVDPYADRYQTYTEDCQICCRPNVLHVTFDEEGGVEVWADVES